MSAISDYISIQNGIFYSKINEIIKSAKPETSYDPPSISWEVVFNDESILDTFEYLEENDNGIERKKYGYEYTRNSGYFFFYEMESIKDPSKEGSLADKLKKPQFHLHIGVTKKYSSDLKKFPELIEHNGPHYKVSEITINEVIGIIIVNFYQENIELINKLKKPPY